jgi:formylglycine-generating enzyme required for sulfatase activity
MTRKILSNVAVILCASLLFAQKGTDLLPPAASAAEPPGSVPVGMANEITGKDGAPMVLVPAGEFTMGIDGWDADEKPIHRVYLDAFYMDKYEVTTGRYGHFMKDTGREPPAQWKDVNPGTDGERPVVGVSWHDADAYCRHYGKRLPTEAEWEKAARGPDGRRFPWGHEEPTRLHANFGSTWTGYETLGIVGSLEAGKSPYGIYDLAGNAWEWVADWYDLNYYKSSPDRNPTGPARGGSKVLRGGSWYNMLYDLRSTNRNYFAPTNRFFDLGFRCLQALPPAP